MNAHTFSIGDEIELAYGHSLPAHARRPGPYPVFGSNGQIGWHDEAAVSGPGIIVGRKGSVGEIAYSKAPFCPIDTTYYVVNRKGHNWRFLYLLLRHSDLTRLNSHSAVPGLNRENVYSILAWFPERPTQEAIANALDCIEEHSQSESKALENALEVKRAAMRELFMRGLRGEPQKETEIGPVPESWEVARLGQVCTLSTGTTPATNDKHYYEGDIPFIKTADVINNRIAAASTFLSQQAIDDYSLKLFPPGTVLMAMYGQGKTRGQVSLLEIDAATTQNAAAIQPSSAMDPAFLWHYLMSCYERLRGMGSLGHVSHLNLGYLRDLLILKPPLGEQKEIAGILDAIDRKIDLHKRKRAVLEELFKSLLHKLMTGEIRINQLDLSALNRVQDTSGQLAT
jgi:type I restriction enzyme S subunit